MQTLFPKYFPKIEKLTHKDDKDPYEKVIAWFYDGTDFELANDMGSDQYQQQLDLVPPLEKLLKEYQPNIEAKDTYFMKEFLLWGLVEFKKLSKQTLESGFQFNDPLGSYISRI